MIIDKRIITNHVESLRRLAKKYPGARIAMAVGTHSPWISRFFLGQGLEVLVANSRKPRAIYANERKSDERDAEMLARIARVDPQLLHPIQDGSEPAQRDLLRLLNLSGGPEETWDRMPDNAPFLTREPGIYAGHRSAAGPF